MLIWPENASALEAKTLERFSRSATREYPIMEAFEASLSLDPWHLRGLRRELAAWLERASVADEICEAIILATHEAAANAIEHADPGTEVTVKGVRADNKLMVMVTNSGEWKDAQAAADGLRGRGMAIMKALMSEVDVQVKSRRTVVRMRRDLSETPATAV